MKRVGTLDGIRGVAILMVVAGHTVQNLQPLDESLRHWLFTFANPGAGVRLFFVLSGYLITELLLQEQSKTGAISLRRFYWRRVLRIFPAFFAYLMILTVADIWMPCGITPQSWTAAATFTWNYAAFWLPGPPEGTWNLGHLWTLSMEEQFYLFWPAVLVVAGRRHALWVAVGLIVWCPLARVGTYFLFPAQRGQLNMMFHTGADSLMIGCAAAMLLQTEVVPERFRRYGRTGTVVACAWLLVVSPLTDSLVRGFGVVGGITIDALAAAWTCAWVHRHASPTVQSVLGRGLLPALGIISYSLYLWQQVFLGPGGRLGSSQVVLPVLAAVAAALASYFLVEQPVLRLRSRSRAFVASAAIPNREPT